MGMYKVMVVIGEKLSFLERTYAFMLKNGVVNRYELEDYAENVLKKDYNYLYRKFIFKLMKQGKVERIRKGLYFARNIYIDEHEIPNKYLIGSKVRSRYYLGYHTALEVLGSAQSVHQGCYISIDMKNRFKRFKFGDHTFQPVIEKDLDKEVIIRNLKNFEVRISSPSRTFVECIHRPDLCIGYEEVYKSLESLGNVSIDNVISVLNLYRCDLLTRAVGFFLEDLVARSPYYSHFEQRDLKRIQHMIGPNRTYLVRGQKGEYVNRWRLYVPEGFKDLFLGVR